MSAKKVKKAIKQQRRERRRALREQERSAKQQAAEASRERKDADRKAAAAERPAAAEPNVSESHGSEPAVSEPVAPESPGPEPAGSESADQAAAPATRRSRASEKKVSEKAASEKRASEKAATEKKTAEKKVTEKKVTEKKVTEKKAAAVKTSEKRISDKKSSVSTAGVASPRRRSGAAVRVGAVVVTAGLVIAGGGSALADFSGADRAPLSPVAGSGVPSPQTGQTYVCPPMPGQADSLTNEGILEYASRDGSAESVFQSLILAGEGEEVPEAEAAQISEESRLNSESLPAGDNGVSYHQETGQERPPLLEVPASPEGAPLAAGGLYEYYADDGPVTGLAVGDCVTAEQSRWFFGPETGPGATSLLTLSNPYDRPSTVEITTYDGDGDRGAPGGRSIVVPPQTVRTVNLAALSGGTASLGVEVSAAGAPVAAQLQSSRAAGLTGSGVEFLPGAENAAGEHHIPAIPMPDTTEAEAEEGNQMAAELWIHVPGQESTTVELQVFGEDGQVALDNPAVFTVEGGEIDTLDLLGLEAGVYDVVVRTDNPSYVGVASRGMGETAEVGAEDEAAAEDAAEEEGEELEEGSPALDFSWGTGARPLAEGSGAILPEIGRSGEAETDLYLFSPEGGDVVYRLVGEDGELSDLQEAEVPSGQAVTITAAELEDVMEDAVAVVIDGPGAGEAGAAVYGSVLTTDQDGRFSISQVRPLQDAEATVPVRIRN